MIYRTAALIVMCFLSVSLQARDYEGYIGGYLMLVDAMDAPKGYCFDLQRFGQHTGLDAPVIVHSCKEGFWKDGTWMVDYPNKGNIYVPAFDLCATPASLAENADLILEQCSEAPLQRFIFQDNGKVLVESDSSYCVAAGETSTGSGAGVRRGTRIAKCDALHASFTTWIVPREGRVYPPINYIPPPPVAIAAEQNAAPSSVANPGEPGEDHPYVRACAPCHAESGEGYQSEHAPKISGLSDWYLTRQMWNYKNDLRGNNEGERWAMQMNYHIEDFTAEQINSYVEYIGTLGDIPAEVTISGNTARGETLYVENCALCHGVDAMGNAQLNSPRLKGMSDWYMIKQLQKYRAGLRGNHPQDIIGALMVAPAKMLPDEQALDDVVAYINSLPD